MNINRCLKQTIVLLNSLINDEVPDISAEEIVLPELFGFADMHKVANMLYPVLKKIGINDESNTMAKFKERYYSGIIIETQQHAYLEKVEKEFERAGIMHMPMKGSVIKHLYPERSLRTATDVDMYIGKKDVKKAQQVMQSIGFEIEACDSEVSNHDAYMINNRICFELHYELLPRTPYFKGCEVCGELEANAQKNEGEEYGYHMSVEDFYVFMIIHIAKHIKHNGMGIRGFLDVALYLKKYRDRMDFAVVEELFRRSDLTKFHQTVLQLVDFWFGGKKDADAAVLELAEHVAASGLMGMENQVVSEELYRDSVSGNRLRYYIQTVFLPMAHMRDKYKILRKIPVLLPFFWGYRIVEVCIFKRKNITKMVNHFNNADIDAGKRSFELKKKIGL